MSAAPNMEKRYKLPQFANFIGMNSRKNDILSQKKNILAYSNHDGVKHWQEFKVNLSERIFVRSRSRALVARAADVVPTVSLSLLVLGAALILSAGAEWLRTT